MIIIVDLDGTLADARHRLHFIKPPPGEKKNWKAFFAGIINDPIHGHVKEMVDLLQQQGYWLTLITGRPESTRRDTEEWLDFHGVESYDLLMRPNNDRRPDFEVKKDLFLSLDTPVSEVFCAFEDRLQVVKMWKELGIPVFVCGEDYEEHPPKEK